MGYIRVYNAGELIDQRELSGDAVSIGRTDDNGIVLSDPGVSRRHAAIVRADGGWVVEDRDSRNGVFLNKQRIKRQKLRYWDEIQIQQFVIRFMATPDARKAPERDAAAQYAEDSEKTQFVSLDTEQDLKRLRAKKRQAYLEYRGADGGTLRHPISAGRSLVFGRSRDADIRLGGWFAPAEAARIERDDEGFQLVPGKRGRVRIEGETLSSAAPIEDGERFEVRGQAFVFFNRLSD